MALFFSSHHYRLQRGSSAHCSVDCSVLRAQNALLSVTGCKIVQLFSLQVNISTQFMYKVGGQQPPSYVQHSHSIFLSSIMQNFKHF